MSAFDLGTVIDPVHIRNPINLRLNFPFTLDSSEALLTLILTSASEIYIWNQFMMFPAVSSYLRTDYIFHSIYYISLLDLILVATFVNWIYGLNHVQVTCACDRK